MSVKLSKKDLGNIGIAQDGYYLGGNVYNYENAIFYLEKLDIEGIKKSIHATGTDIEYLIKRLEKYDLSQVAILTMQVFYSAGEYGNNGQMHKINIYDKNVEKYGKYNMLDTIYVYYC